MFVNTENMTVKRSAYEFLFFFSFLWLNSRRETHVEQGKHPVIKKILICCLLASVFTFGNEAARKKIEDLRAEIQHHDHLYFVENNPEISDSQYDSLKQKLSALEKQHPKYASKKDVAPKPETADTTHSLPVLSLQKIYSASELRSFYNTISEKLGTEGLTFTVEPKYDGCSIVARYENGILTRILTRGNGHEGEDVTENAKSTVPEQLTTDLPPEIFEVRGEIYVARPDFLTWNKQSEKTFKTPRNLAVGSLRLKNPKEAAERPLKAVFFALGTHTTDINSQQTLIKTLSGFGFTVPLFSEQKQGLNELAASIKMLRSRLGTMEEPTDGLVLKLNEFSQRKTLGTGETHPNWAAAVKFKADYAASVLRKIKIQVGRTGRITPVAIFDTVEIGGVEIKRASLFSFNYIKEKDIRIGDVLNIERAGDVIPHIIGAVHNRRDGTEREIPEPEICTFCGKPSVHEGSWLLCGNHRCPERRKKAIEHFGSRDCMDIHGLGPAMAEALVDHAGIRSPSDLYLLTEEDIPRLTQQTGTGVVKLQNMLESLNASKTESPDRLLVSLSIAGIGPVTARKLLKRFMGIEQLSNANIQTLDSVPGVGRATAKSIVNYFINEDGKREILRLKELGLRLSVIDPEANFFKGNIFVFTGRLSNMTRSQAKRRVQRLGGETRDSVSQKTNYLVVGTAGGQKLQAAVKKNIAIMSERSFLSELQKAEKELSQVQ